MFDETTMVDSPVADWEDCEDDNVSAIIARARGAAAREDSEALASIIDEMTPAEFTAYRMRDTHTFWGVPKDTERYDALGT